MVSHKANKEHHLMEDNKSYGKLARGSMKDKFEIERRILGKRKRQKKRSKVAEKPLTEKQQIEKLIKKYALPEGMITEESTLDDVKQIVSFM